MVGPRRELDADEVRDLLAELGRRLHAEGVEATVYAVGGAAIALEMDARRVTADDDAVPLEIDGIAVTTASPEHLLAMKMASFRPGRDQTDLELLFDHLGITDPARAADIAVAVYGEYGVALPGRDELVLSAQAVLDRRRATGRAECPEGA